MIVATTPNSVRFVTQPDHAALAGQFAVHWGGETGRSTAEFARPDPFASVVTAAEVHDDGWRAYDRRPRLGDDGTPETFTELPAAVWTDLYDHGVDRAAALDRYAGLLVSLHGTGLRRRRYGLSPAWPDTPPAFEGFVERHQAGQRALLDAMAADEDDDRLSPADDALLTALHETGTVPGSTDSRLWANYRLLQAWDTLSLACCTTVSPPDRDAIASVPPSPGAPAVTLDLASGADGAVVVDPYPFDEEPLVATVPARTVAWAAFDTESELVEAYDAAAREHLEVEFRART